MKIYFHIGQAKTGTSAIQSFLNVNRELLVSKDKILYPNFDFKDPGKGIMLNHSSFFESMHTNINKEPFEKFRNCLEYCENNNIRKVVVSGELFEFQWLPELFLKIVETFKVDYSIILYLRRQDNYLEAAWKQWGHKQKDVNTIQEFAKVLHMNWHETIIHWLTYFKPDNFIVRPYEKSRIGPNVITDFMQILGIYDIDCYMDPPDSNINKNNGLHSDVVEIMRLCRNMTPELHNHSLIEFMYNSLPNGYKKEPLRSYGFLSPKERLAIVNEFSDKNNQISKFFFGDNTNLFNDPLPDINDPWEPKQGITLETAIPVLMEIIFKQFEDIRALKNEIYGDNPIIRFSNPDLFIKSNFNNQIENRRLLNDDIHFTAISIDPIIILPRFVTPKAAIIIKVDITVPENTLIQLYYRTSIFKSYSEDRSVRHDAIKGRQIILLRIPVSKISGRLRLDPGITAGNYIIHSIEIYF